MQVLRHLLEPQPSSAKRREVYKAKQVLGEGSFGVVKKALNLETNEFCAMKIIKKQSDDRKRTIQKECVEREVSILRQLRHQNIIALLDYFETRDKYYLVFELYSFFLANCRATGGELYDRISLEGRFTEKDAAKIVYSILSGLSVVHQKDIVHRDLKPENILYKDESRYSKVMIADFGVSNFVKDDEMLQMMAGSPGYAAPEVINGTGYGKSADLWSLGAITYTMLCGYHPFHFCSDVKELREAICAAKYVFDAPYWLKISDDAKRFISSLMNLNADARPTAERAKFHSWIVKRCAEAQEAIRKKSADSESLVKSPADEVAEIKSALLDIEKAELVEDINLVEDVWENGRIFDARQKWKKAMRLVTNVNRVHSTLKRNKNDTADSCDSVY